MVKSEDASQKESKKTKRNRELMNVRLLKW